MVFVKAMTKTKYKGHQHKYKTFNAECQTFARGRWQREMPERPGTYPVADADGVRGTDQFRTVLIHPEFGAPWDTQNDERSVGTNWEGWWWSKPLPDMPSPYMEPVFRPGQLVQSPNGLEFDLFEFLESSQPSLECPYRERWKARTESFGVRDYWLEPDYDEVVESSTE